LEAARSNRESTLALAPFFLAHLILRTMKIFPPLLIGLSFFLSCSTSTEGPYSAKEIQENIHFHHFRKVSDPKLQKKILDSSYALMRATYPEFLIDVKRLDPGGSLLETLPRGLAHGDFHPLQMSWRNENAALDDWDTVEHKALWHDLVRMESAARLLASEEGLRGYPESVCIDSYAARFVTSKPGKIQGQPLKPSPQKIESFEDFSTHPVWQKADDPSRIPPQLLEDFRAWIMSKPDLPFKSNAPMKRLVSGVGSLMKEKVLVLDARQQLWELKEVDALAGGCARYEALSKTLQTLGSSATPNPVHACWSWQERSFTLLRWDARYWGPDTDDFRSAAELGEHVRWMCENLADFHKASLDTRAIREWTLALRSAAPVRTRLREISSGAFKSYQDAYRMILAEQE